MGLQLWRSTQAHGYLTLHKEKYVLTFLGLIKKSDFTSLQHEAFLLEIANFSIHFCLPYIEIPAAFSDSQKGAI